ncbi:MAG: site-specific DNA-methyltransferase [Bacteroidales bacterium]|nr:site-specific DNA-methyltransferase [Bacteroidales bacterium]
MTKYINQILQGNTVEVLKQIPSDSVDLGVTSPPYNKGEKNKGWLVKNVKYNSVQDCVKEDVYQQNQIEVLNELYRIIKPGGSFFYNHKTRWDKGEMFHPIMWLTQTSWTVRQEIIWDRMIAANIRGWRFWQVDERIYWLYKPIDKNKIGKELQSKHSLLTSVWRFPPERNNPHPAPFPLELPTRIITSILNDEAGVVIDPYCGSGTTLVAAKLLQKDYIGIDISEDYISFAKERLQNCQSEKKKVEEELQKHFVEKTFKERKLNKENTGKFKNYKETSQFIHKKERSEALSLFDFAGL